MHQAHCKVPLLGGTLLLHVAAVLHCRNAGELSYVFETYANEG